MKTCRQCGVEKPLAQFNKAKANRDGLDTRCAVCKRKERRSRYAANPEKYSEQRRASYLRNREKELRSNAEWKKRSGKQYPPSRESALRAGRKWRMNNPHRMRMKEQQRRARKLSATPAWADLSEIAMVYERARMLEVLTGKPHHVDHVVPLKGESVCGLNVHYNLRAIPAATNLRKGNRVPRDPRAAYDRAFLYYCMVIDQARRDGVWNLDKKLARALA